MVCYSNKTTLLFRKVFYLYFWSGSFPPQGSCPRAFNFWLGSETLSFLNGKATYTQLLLQQRKQEEVCLLERWGAEVQWRGNAPAPGMYIPNHMMYSVETDPTTCIKGESDWSFLTLTIEVKSTVTCSLWAARSKLQLWQWSTTRGCTFPNTFVFPVSKLWSCEKPDHIITSDQH